MSSLHHWLAALGRGLKRDKRKRRIEEEARRDRLKLEATREQMRAEALVEVERLERPALGPNRSGIPESARF
ncbi:MAG TPA: hypothetical protein VFE60_08370 [Roseiarcus sp.]|jgi:hypothetical protein|nr:hypothetical protein [Roseiarcus sp.]